MSSSPLASRLAGLPRGRTPLALAVGPLLFVYFGLFLPVASAVHFPLSFQLGAGVIIAAASATVFAVERWLARVRELGAPAQIREFVGVVIGSALLAWALLRVPAAALLRNGEFWAATLAATLVFALSTIVRRRIARQEFFLSAVVRMATAGREGPEGDVVTAVTRELSVEAGESAEALLSLRRWLIFFLIWLVGLLVVTGWGLHAAGAAVQVGSCLSAMVFLGALVSVGRLQEEQHILTLGLVPAQGHRSIETGVAAVLFTAAALFAGILALRPALVSQGALAALGAWILWLLSRIPSHAAPPPAPPPPPRVIAHPPPDFAGRLRAIAPVHGSHLVATILTYVGWALAAAAVAGLLWLLLAPLFRLRRRRVSISSTLAAFGARIATALRRWASEIRDSVAGLREARGTGVNIAAAGDEARGAKRRRRGGRLIVIAGGERRFAGAFRRLAKWGGDRGAAFATSLGPQEYAALLASRVPDLRAELERIAELYELQLFSPAPLSGRERSRYFKMIKEVVRSGRS